MIDALPPAPPALSASLAAVERSEATSSELRIAAALTDAQIEVDTSFSGASIVLYGAVFNPTDKPADVVLVIRGPDDDIRLVKRTRHNGVWLNSRPVVFEGAPGFYMTASTRPLSEITDFTRRRQLGLGVDHLKLAAPSGEETISTYGVRDVVINPLGEDYLDWRRAVVRLKEKSGLYRSAPDGIAFVDRGLFRAEVELPSTAPTGQYYAEVWLFQDQQPVSVSNLTLTVEKVGLERDIYTFAHRHPWLHGFLAVFLAAGIGYLASRVFRNR